MGDSYRIFDRTLVRRRRTGRAGLHDLFLFDEGASGLAGRLADINRNFRNVLAIGPGLSPGILKNKPDRFIEAGVAEGEQGGILLDEEALPFGEDTFDLVLSNLTLHWVNDLPGTLVQIRRILKPDGLFLGVMFGGDSLVELRESLMAAEAEVEGGASPRVAPFVDVRDAGNLLARAGFALPVADVDTVRASYADALSLMKDLKAMGENNVMVERRKGLSRRETLMSAANYYRDRFSDEEGRIPATFQLLFLTGWAPAPDQPKPLKPGSGKISLKDALKKP